MSIDDPGHSEARRSLMAVAIGVVATFVGAALVPLVIVVFLAFVAQVIIAGH